MKDILSDLWSALKWWLLSCIEMWEWPHHHVMWVEWSLDFFFSVCVLHIGVTWSTLSLTFSSQSFFFFFWIRIQTFRHLLKLDKREDAIELTQNWGDQFKKLVIKWFYFFSYEHNICFKIMLGTQQFLQLLIYFIMIRVTSLKD